MPPLYETYRPAGWGDVVGHEKAIGQLRGILSRGAGGMAIAITGPSGVGKTTLARIVAHEWSGGCKMDIEELDGDAVSVEAVRSLMGRWAQFPWGGKGRSIIVNEIHAITDRARVALLTALEKMPPSNLVIGTTTDCDMFGNASGAFGSRFVSVPLSAQGLAPKLAEKAREIAQKEGLDGRPEEQYLRLVQECRNNMRSVLQAIAGGRMMAAE